jgi:hypothetical protein
VPCLNWDRVLYFIFPTALMQKLIITVSFSASASFYFLERIYNCEDFIYKDLFIIFSDYFNAEINFLRYFLYQYIFYFQVYNCESF